MSWLSALFAPPTPPPAMNLAAQQQALTEIDTGDFRGFIIGDVPIVLSKDEKAAAVLPYTTFWEPRAIRIKSGSSGGSSIRIMKGLSIRSGSFGSTSESHDELRRIDTGTLVITNHRIVFVGHQRTVSVDMKTLIGVDYYSDGIGVHCEKRNKIQCFSIPLFSIDSTDTATQVVENFPITGQMLHRIIAFATNPTNANVNFRT